MPFSRIVSSFCFLITLCFAMQFQSVFATDQPLEQVCHIVHNFTANSTFEANLNRLLASLAHTAPPTRFDLRSIGQRPNQVYGLALCRADIFPKDCQSCIFDAIAEIRKGCPAGKRAILWTDSCFLKYSFENFFGRIDDDITEGLTRTLPNISDPWRFSQEKNQFLSKLVEGASTNPQLFRASKLRVGALNLYGLAQCTRDLNGSSCKKCLSEMGLINGTDVGYLVNGSCLKRIENHPF